MDDLKNINSMVEEIKQALLDARGRAAVQVNMELLTAYWNIGRIIVEHEQGSQERAVYGKQTLRQLSKELTNAPIGIIVSYIPDKEQLIAQVEAVLKEWYGKL